MPEATAPAQPQIARRCPACGRVSAASERCLHCWRDIATVTPLTPEEAASALTVAARLARRQKTGWLTAGRLWWCVPLAAVVLLLGWWVYAALVAQPTPPGVPSSTARSAAAGFWTSQHGDNRGTRSTSASSHLEGVEEWRVSLVAPAATAPITDGRLVVVPLQDGRLIGLDASSGKTLWTTTLSLSNPPLSAPTLAGDRIYVSQREGLIQAVDATDGKEVWRRDAADSFEASPLVADGVVYTYSANGLRAFDAEDGRPLWEQTTGGGAANLAPVIEGDRLILASADRTIVFDRVTGRQTYYVTFSRTQPSSVAIRDGEVTALYGRYATAFDSSSRHSRWIRLANANIGGDAIRSFWFRMHLYGMAPAVPMETTVWDVTSLPRRTMAAAVGTDVVVVTSPDGAVTALGRADGKSVWTAKTNRLIAAPIITADGVLFAEEDRLLLLDVATGERRLDRRVEGLRGATPTAAATYLATAAGDIIALR